MKIVIDMQGAQSVSRCRGVGRYSMALTQAIVKLKGQHEILLALNGAFEESTQVLREHFLNYLSPSQIRVWYPPVPCDSLNLESAGNRACAEQIFLAFVSSLAPDVLLMLSLFEGLVDNAITNLPADKTSFRTAIILYDLIPYVYPEIYLQEVNYKSWYLQKINLLKKADILLSISKHSRQDAIRHLSLPPEKIIDISAGISEHFKPATLSEEDISKQKNAYGITGRYILYTGGLDSRKNFDALLLAYSKLPMQLRKMVQLVIVCQMTADAKKKFESRARELNLSPKNVVFTGFVPEEDLVRLYQACALFVFPSWYEGFGLPVLEAMRCGVPVLASNVSSLPEVAPCAEALFDPHSPEELAEKMLAALTDEELRRKLIELGLKKAELYSWEKSAELALNAIEKTVDEPRDALNHSSGQQKSKLAFVSPLPSLKTGIAYYSAELLTPLAQHYEIEVIVDQSVENEIKHLPNICIRTSTWFMQHAQNYDRILYHIGNSPFHSYMIDLLEKHPGVVVLHDFYLAGIRYYCQDNKHLPNYFMHALYHSHGYGALDSFIQEKLTCAEVQNRYPCNLAIIQNSLGIINHSSYATSLLEEWYGLKDKSLHTVRMLRNPPAQLNRYDIRVNLGIKNEDFLVCSFGNLVPTKLNSVLTQAWVNSKLATNKNCWLVFVGEPTDPGYIKLIRSCIDESQKLNIKFTGWVDAELYRNYLTAADLAVQLRSHSRGKTSAAVLDCMNYGVCTIVNAHGSLAELDQQAVFMLPDSLTEKELVDALELLWQDTKKRETIANYAKQYVADQCNPEICAQAYYDAIEACYQSRQSQLQSLVKNIAKINGTHQYNPMLIANSLAQSFVLDHQPQILVDISVLVQVDSKTGIQRVERAILLEWLNNPPAGFRIEPIYTVGNQPYRYARKFMASFLGWPSAPLVDEFINFQHGDLYFVIGLNSGFAHLQQNFYCKLQSAGVRVLFMVHDLIPCLYPSLCATNFEKLHESWLKVVAKSDGAVCVSQAVAAELSEWLTRQNIARENFKITYFHHGADIEASLPEKEVMKKSKAISFNFADLYRFLMVGTLEPRKGHADVLAAFERLWQDGVDASLIIVGKRGWKVEQLLKKIKKHPQLHKKLFWFEGINDADLEQLYQTATCLIAASYAEGFGLPLIEAARRRLPIIARDIPVFREVAGEHAYYFQQDDPQGLAANLKQWLDLYQADAHPRSDSMPWLTWKQSTKQLERALGLISQESHS